jgi:AcrR family transcriptional regulator
MTTPTRTRMSDARRGELLDAVLSVLREVGYDALTMDAVAARARTSKATLYRQWEGKPGLVVEALRHGAPAPAPTPDTGSLRGDLLAMVEHDSGQRAAKTAEDTLLVQSLIQAMITDAELRTLVREHLLAPGMARLHVVLNQAIARGEVAPDCPALPYVGQLLIMFGLGHSLLSDESDVPDFPAFLDSVVVPLLISTKI